MVFHGRGGGVPTVGDCDALNNAYIAWELYGNGFVGSYSSRRSVDSSLVLVKSSSIDPGSNAVSSREGISYPGEISADDAEMLPTTVAPLVHWLVDPSTGRRRGRTYAVGLTRQAVDNHDAMRLTSDARFDLARVFSSLIEVARDQAGVVLVKLVYRSGGRKLDPMPALDITGASMDALLCGNQRRRSRDLTPVWGSV